MKRPNQAKEIDAKMVNEYCSNILMEPIATADVTTIDHAPAIKIASKKRPLEQLDLILPNSKKHKKFIHKTNDPCVCEICNKRTKHSREIIYHRREHLNE